MASGQTLLIFSPLDNQPPGTVYATLDVTIGTSTPAESVPRLAFDDTSVEYAGFYSFMPRSYSGNGVTITIVWSAAQATNKGVWEAAFRRVGDDVEDLDTTAQTYDFNSTGDIDPASAVGEVAYDTITFTNGADMDSVVAGDYFILRIRRPAPSGTKITGDCSIHMVEIKET